MRASVPYSFQREVWPSLEERLPLASSQRLPSRRELFISDQKSFRSELRKGGPPLLWGVLEVAGVVAKGIESVGGDQLSVSLITEANSFWKTNATFALKCGTIGALGVATPAGVSPQDTATRRHLVDWFATLSISSGERTLATALWTSVEALRADRTALEPVKLEDQSFSSDEPAVVTVEEAARLLHTSLKVPDEATDGAGFSLSSAAHFRKACSQPSAHACSFLLSSNLRVAPLRMPVHCDGEVSAAVIAVHDSSKFSPLAAIGVSYVLH